MSGKACVVARCANAEDTGFWSQIVRLKPGMKKLRITASVRTEPESQGNISISAYEFKTKKWLAADYKLIEVKGAAEWKKGTAEFDVPEGTGSVRVALWCNLGKGGHGRVWFDDIVLIPLGYERAPVPNNLALNAGFERVQEGRDGLPQDWSFTKSKGEAAPLMACPQPHGGKASPGIEVGPGGTGLLCEWAPMARGWETYRLSAWIRTEGEVRALGSLSVYDLEKKKWLAAGYELFNGKATGGWQKVVGYYEAPPVDGVLKVALWARSEAEGTGRVWFDDVELMPVDEVPPMLYLPKHPEPAATAEDRSRGFTVFNRNYLDLMPPAYRPSQDEIQRPLTFAAAAGEHEPISVGIYALDDLVELKAELAELRSDKGNRIAGENIDVRAVRYLVKRSHYAMSDRLLVPTYLEHPGVVKAPKGQVRQFWFTVHVPADASPGEYRGTIRLVRAKGRGEARLPVTLRVHPFRLDSPKGMAFGMYDSLQRTMPGENFMAQKYRDMRAHGMTTVGFYGALGASVDVVDGQVQVRFAGRPGLEIALDAYSDAGFTEPVVWLMGSDVRRFAVSRGLAESKAYGDAYKAVIQATLAEGKRRGWPEIIYQPADEVFSHKDRFDACFRDLQLLKEIPVRTEMDGTNVNPKLAEQTYPFTDCLVHCYGPMLYNKRVYPRKEWLRTVEKFHADGKRIWFYNTDTTGYHVETMRFAAGLYMLWSNADGLLSWAYSSADEEPYDDYSGPRGDTVFFYPPWGGRKGGPALGWEGLREGVDDYRYARTLLNRIEAAERGKDTGRQTVAKKARRDLAQWLDKLDLSRLRTNRSMQGNWTNQTTSNDGRAAVSGSFTVGVGLSFNDYGRFRAMCARYIIELTD
ncbi:MAG: DUF6067 family protein [Planctomycetota bacterium]|nr:DUF6067 family protein [Planctomycetota bacterium]MDP7251921.1 DUF6067 family protein [Planctomycetota bacterium]